MSLSNTYSNIAAPVQSSIADVIGSVEGLPTDLSTRKKAYLRATGYGQKRPVDAGFVVALLSSRDAHRQWAMSQAPELPPPWSTREAVLSEAFYLLGARGVPSLGTLLRRRALLVAFEVGENLEPVLRLMDKYRDVPMSLAGACLVRMSETLANAVILTTEEDFRIYRRHSRQTVPCVTPE